MRFYAVVIAAFVVVTAFLGYRVYTLDNKVDALTRQLGATTPVAAEPQKDSKIQAAAPPSTGRSHEQRIHALELALASLRADFRSLERATEDMPEKGATDQQILSVMKEQGAKVMEKHLRYHRDKWLDQRETALNSFVKRFDLDPKQNDYLWGLLSGEIDKMIEILRKPESFEDPERAAAEWKQMLLDTDSAAHKVLEPAKAVAWDQQRFWERKFLWPWLPE